jgi:Type II secretion system (T2SS), protein M subtype b
MMNTVSMPLRRGLALVLLLTGLVMGWHLAVQPIIDLSLDRRQDIATLSDQLSHLQAIIVRRPELERRAVLEQRTLGTEGGLWNQASAAEVAAGMQNLMRQVVADGNGRLRSTALVAQTNEHGFGRVTVHFSIEGVLSTAQATLAAIQASRPAMFVDSMAIHATGAGDAQTPPGLTMELDVSGYTPAAG